MNFKLTNAGLNVLLRGLSGDSIVFTKVEIGNGAAQAPADATALSNSLLALDILSIEQSTSFVTLSTKFSNSTVTAGFRHTETGIFVQDQDDATQEILYAYGTQEEGVADYISASDDDILETEMEFNIFVGEVENISAAINESLVYASKSEFDAHTENTNNPHSVTKAQVGLGNVPNVSTNNQEPTFTEATTLQNLTTGEKLSKAFGKISKAIRSFIDHNSNRSNPHGVTASQAGAAPRTHTHSAADINSGVLGVSRGGTGSSEMKDFVKKATGYGALYAVTGIYTGTGTGGPDHPCRLDFNETVHFLAVVMRGGDYTPYGRMIIGIKNCADVRNLFTDIGAGELLDSCRNRFDFLGKTVEWYTPAGAEAAKRQLNHPSSTYAYIALCSGPNSNLQ